MVFTATKGFIHFSKEKHFSTTEICWDTCAQLEDTTWA